MIITNADDFGLNNSVNNAIVQCFRLGYINQTTIMVNMPAFYDALELSKENNFIDKVGLHVNLDEGIPLTESMKENCHFCENGNYVKGNIRGIKKFYLNKTDRICVEKEIEAQILKFISSGFTLLHIDSHHHVHTNFSIMRIITRLGKKYRINTIRLCAYHQSDSIFKRLYKFLMNSYIKLFFITTQVFVTNRDYYNNKYTSVEIMTHPDIIDGKLVEVIKRVPLSTRSY